MASLVAKKKGHQLYYYVVESARVEGKPRIVHQTYLGTAEKVADLVKDRTAPIPVSAASPAILTSELEVQKKESSTDRPPILPPPAHDPVRTGGQQ